MDTVKRRLPHGSVIAFGIAVLLRFPRLNVPDANSSFFFSPRLKNTTHIFRAVIIMNFSRAVPPFNNVLQGADYPLRRQGKINLNAEPFTVKVVHDVQEADTAAILKLVVHKVHRPYLVHGFRNRQLFRLVPLSPLLQSNRRNTYFSDKRT